MSYIDDIERLGAAVENGLDRDVAIRELRSLLERHYFGCEYADHTRTGALIDAWRDVRRWADVIREISPRQLRLLAEIVGFEKRDGDD